MQAQNYSTVCMAQAQVIKMKLTNILYEAAKTSKEALKAGLGLYIWKSSEELVFILFSPERCIQATESYFSKHQDRLNSKEEVLDWLETYFGNRVIVGSVMATRKDTPKRDDLWMVLTSAAVQKYGPLIYEMVMASIYPNYIRSDFTLTPDSRRVWNVMYTRSDVEHSWIGNWGSDELITSWNVSDMFEQKNIRNVLNKIENETPITETEFDVDFVQKLNSENNEKLGPFYAYRRSGGRSKDVSKLIEAGDAAIEELADNFNVNKLDITNVLMGAYGKQFDRLYKRHRKQ